MLKRPQTANFYAHKIITIRPTTLWSSTVKTTNLWNRATFTHPCPSHFHLTVTSYSIPMLHVFISISSFQFFFNVSYLTLFSLVAIDSSPFFWWCLALSSSLCLFKELFHDNKTSQMHLALPWHLTWHFSNLNYAIRKQPSGHNFRPMSQICGFCSNKQILR